MSCNRLDVIEAVQEFLDDVHMKYRIDENVFSFSMTIDSSLSSVDVKIYCDETRIAIYALSPLNARPQTMDDVMSFITYANYDMVHGCFEMDLSDGEIRFRNICRFDSKVPSKLELLMTFETAINMMKKFGDGLLKMFIGIDDPESAYKACIE